MSSELLVHIGYHKAASTWLQKHVFPAERLGFCDPWSMRDVAQQLLRVDPFEFDPSATSSFFAPGIAQARDRGLTPVLSHEALSGSVASGGYNSRLLAERLLSTFPGSRVLIVIREQKSMILSSYKRFVEGGGPASIRRFLIPPRSGGGRIPLARLEYWDYHRLVRFYLDGWGRRRVLVLPFEMLAGDRTQFAGAITSFAGKPGESHVTAGPENVALSGLIVALKRRANRLLRVGVNPWGPFDSPRLNAAFGRVSRVAGRWVPAAVSRWFDSRMLGVIEELARDRYRESNRITSGLTGLDLAAWGYET